MQLKATVKKVQTIAVVGLCALTLGGCALGIDAARLAADNREPGASTTHAPTVAAPATVPADAGLADTDSGPAGGSYLPPLGTYDPATSSLPPFDPCTEIPAEAFAEVGLPQGYSSSDIPLAEGTCAYTGSGPTGNRVMLTLSKEEFTEQDLKRTDMEEVVYQLDNYGEITGFQDPAFLGTDCNFVVSTVRGNVSFLYDIGHMDQEGNQACNEGIEVIKHFLK